MKRAALVTGITLAIVAGVVFRFWTTSHLWLDEALSVNIAPAAARATSPRRCGPTGTPRCTTGCSTDGWRCGVTATSPCGPWPGCSRCSALPVAWLLGRRIGGSPAAWTLTVVFALTPFAIRYGTEARMYSLVMLLVLGGRLALLRALERPTVARLAVVTAISGRARPHPLLGDLVGRRGGDRAGLGRGQADRARTVDQPSSGGGGAGRCVGAAPVARGHAGSSGSHRHAMGRGRTTRHARRPRPFGTSAAATTPKRSSSAGRWRVCASWGVRTQGGRRPPRDRPARARPARAEAVVVASPCRSPGSAACSSTPPTPRATHPSCCRSSSSSSRGAPRAEGHARLLPVVTRWWSSPSSAAWPMWSPTAPRPATSPPRSDPAPRPGISS